MNTFVTDAHASAASPVLVTGATGFIGRHTVAALQSSGYRVRALVRRPGQWAMPGVEMFHGHMSDAAALRAACEGCAAVIHLAAQTRDAPDIDEVNIGGARRLVEACLASGCRRAIVVSTQSAKIFRQGDYARTKAAADAMFLASGLDVTVMRPSVVYGTADDGIFGTLRRVVAAHRAVPVLGDGRWRSAPVHVDDVAKALVRALDAPASIGQVYDLGGPGQCSFDELLDRIAVAQGLPAPIKLHVPLPVSLAMASLLARLMKSPPITRSNVLGSNQDTQIDIGPAQRDLDFAPLNLEDGFARLFPAQDDSQVLAQEARVLARYLVGANPSPEVVQRYVDAHRQLLLAQPDKVTAFARRHPSCLGLLDAAAATRGTAAPLRRRVLLMATVLEATPEHARRFLPAPRSPLATVAAIAWHGTRATLMALLGMPLYLWLRAGRSDA
ncbi:NAD-dependent epimerase/dehydratase family protein [Variovorax sp. J22R133]|uniref:NAD-dependent epimerase/dehydratase family protein n=1 Tax=Variovorax brevis TaxID=3053503 RepID=UPI002576F1EB|nr:NAD-dependent epimerase/dehydratase family protein [Variovorax sp. J22R133]MDM0113748.1 NAD-dependent epimerase/dehydratase family protein [Variovorax sp. J22R133]